MPSTRAHRLIPTTLLISLAVLASLLVPASGAEAATKGATPGKVPSFSKAIEGYARYVGQSVCSPTAKPGTLKLQKWLITRYKGSGSSGISRGCKVGGKSEHKEGRAFDWRVNVHSAKQKKQAAAFLKLAFAKDRYGNGDAVARRMGIIYVIWNDRIYSASNGFTSRPYHHAACKTKPLAKCGDTLRHRDHLHISLGWAGAKAVTSFWDGSVSGPVQAPKPPKPVTKPAAPALLNQTSRPVVAISVPATSTGVKTSFSLKAGTTYRLVATGYYRYGTSTTKVADAACSWRRTDDAGWSRSVAGSTSTTQLKLLVAGTSRWSAASGQPCDVAGHTYVWDYKPTTTGPVTLALADSVRTDNTGSLTLRILKAGADVGSYRTSIPAASTAPAAPATPVTSGDVLQAPETVVVAARTGGHSQGVLEAGRRYTVHVEGTYAAADGVVADAECSKATNGSWQRQRSADPLHPELDSFGLYRDGQDLQSGTCSETHEYDYVVVPERDGQATFAVWDSVQADNWGQLTVTISPRRRSH